MLLSVFWPSTVTAIILMTIIQLACLLVESDKTWPWLEWLLNPDWLWMTSWSTWVLRICCNEKISLENAATSSKVVKFELKTALWSSSNFADLFSLSFNFSYKEQTTQNPLILNLSSLYWLWLPKVEFWDLRIRVSRRTASPRRYHSQTHCWTCNADSHQWQGQNSTDYCVTLCFRIVKNDITSSEILNRLIPKWRAPFGPVLPMFVVLWQIW